MTRIVTLILYLLVLWCVPLGATTYYISPSGDNGDNGLSDTTPKLTFAHVLPLLNAGDTLNLLDGTYTAANSGFPDSINCATTHNDGSNVNPITIKATNERAAHLQQDGSGEAVAIRNCAYWVFSGLHVSSADKSATSGAIDVIIATDSDHLTFERLLVHHNNRYINSHLMLLVRTHDSLIEESEFYSFHRHAIEIGGAGSNASNRNTVRRVYANSRGHADLAGCSGAPPNSSVPYCSFNPSVGEAAVTIYPGSDNILENVISEGNGYISDVQATATSSGNAHYGMIGLNNVYGWIPVARGSTTATMPVNTSYTDIVCVNSSVSCFWARSAKNTTILGATFIGSARGLYVDQYTNPGDGTYSTTATNVIIENFSLTGLHHTNQASESYDYLNFYNNGTNYNSASNVTNVTTDNPLMGSCRLWVPSTSPLSGAGSGGADVGATVLYATENGILTTNKLWDQTTGAFNYQGDIVAGINDVAGASLFDVHERLNVNYNGCSFPPWYGGSALVPDLTITDGVISFTGSGWGNDMWRIIVNKTPALESVEQYFGILDSLGKFDAAGSKTFNDLANSVVVIPSGQTRYIRICPAMVGVGCLVTSDEVAYTAP